MSKPLKPWSVLVLSAVSGVLFSVTAFAGIEEHNPNPMPEWLQQELAVYSTDGVEEARAEEEEEKAIERDVPTTGWSSGAMHAQQYTLDDQIKIKWRLALHGLEYVTIEELLSEEYTEEGEEGSRWSPEDSIEDEGTRAEETTESDENQSDSLETETSALSVHSDAGPPLHGEAGEDLNTGCNTGAAPPLSGLMALLLGLWIATMRLRWS